MQTREYYTTAVNTLMVSDSSYAGVFAGIIPAVETLYIWSSNLDDLLTRPRVAIVGSRKLSAYGRAVTEQFAAELARAGVVIVSGLAYGVDAVAHQAALDAGGLTIAVLPSSVEKVYPTAHAGLAQRLLEQGGALISEYPPGATIAYKNQFIERNRIVSGMSDVLLITEAAINSGTMHTARFAVEQGKEVFAVPGSITSPTSEGTNNLIRSGATPALKPADILQLLGIDGSTVRELRGAASTDEQCILDLLIEHVSDGEQLLSRSSLPIERFNQTLTMMELTGKVKALGANQWQLR